MTASTAERAAPRATVARTGKRGGRSPAALIAYQEQQGERFPRAPRSSPGPGITVDSRAPPAHIPALASALPVAPGTLIPEQWPGDRFDLIWVTHQHQQVIFEPELIVRQSTQASPAATAQAPRPACAAHSAATPAV